jgi:hypothetical protein
MSRILGIGSWDRSGSSIIARALGTCGGVVSVGEINNLWARGVNANLRCGCGEPFADCDFWSQTMDRAFSGGEGRALLNAATEVAETASNHKLLRAKLTHTRHRDQEHYTEALRRLFDAVVATSGASLVVDSSKAPWHLESASRAASSFRLIHLVRDPRGVVYSHKKVMKYDPGRDEIMNRDGAAFTTAGWMYRNLVLGALWRSSDRMLVSYEQFSTSPRSVIEQILRFSDQPVGDLSFIEGSTVALATEHSVSGNPVRFKTGSIDIEVDDEWKSELSPWTKYWVGAATAPMRISYQRRANTDLKHDVAV